MKIYSIFIIILLLIPFTSATDKISSFIILDISEETQNNKATQITAHLQTNNGLPIQKELITFFINDKIFTNKLTDKNGLASIQIQIAEKTEIFVKNLELDETLGQLLVAEGFSTIEEIDQSSESEISNIDGVDENTAKELKERSKEYLKKESDEISKKLNDLGIIPGIKVDKGLNPLPGGGDVETFCSGLDGLVERAAKYYEQGARFAKWRAVLQITNDGCPSKLSIQENAWGLARYARSVQESGLVPIIEPEILMVGDDIVGLDLFDSSKTLKKLMPKLIRSFALDAIELKTKEPYQPKIEDAEDLLRKSAAANITTHPGVGEGDNIRLQSEEVVGGALVLDNKVIHLSVFKNDDLSRSENPHRDRGSRVRRASHRRSHRSGGL